MRTTREPARWSREQGARRCRASRWWYPEGTRHVADPFGLWATNINVCTADDDANIDPVMGAWLLRGLPCRVAAIEINEEIAFA